jgi:hypothetical protein
MAPMARVASAQRPVLLSEVLRATPSIVSEDKISAVGLGITEIDAVPSYYRGAKVCFASA